MNCVFYNFRSGYFPRLYAPAQFRLVSDTGDERDHVLAGATESGKIGLQDLANIKDFIGPLAQFGRVADGVAILQGVDLTEVVGNAPVMTGKSNISIPAGGGLEVTGALGQTLQAFVLIDFNLQIQGRNAQCTEAAV